MGKLLIDEIVRKIYEEDARAEQMRIEKMQATKRYLDEFTRTRNEWRQQEKQRFEEENHKIMRYAEEQRAREEEREKMKGKTYEQQMQIAEVLGKQLEKERMKREEREQIKLELAWEEERCEEREKEREEK